MKNEISLKLSYGYYDFNVFDIESGCCRYESRFSIEMINSPYDIEQWFINCIAMVDKIERNRGE